MLIAARDKYGDEFDVAKRLKEDRKEEEEFEGRIEAYTAIPFFTAQKR